MQAGSPPGRYWRARTWPRAESAGSWRAGRLSCADDADDVRERQPDGGPGWAGSVQGLLPTRLAAISVRTAGSHSKTASAWVKAIRAAVAAGLGTTTCRWSSSVTIMTSNRPSSPSGPAVQLALTIVPPRRCLLDTGL